MHYDNESNHKLKTVSLCVYANIETWNLPPEIFLLTFSLQKQQFIFEFLTSDYVRNVNNIYFCLSAIIDSMLIKEKPVVHVRLYPSIIFKLIMPSLRRDNYTGMTNSTLKLYIVSKYFKHHSQSVDNYSLSYWSDIVLSGVKVNLTLPNQQGDLFGNPVNLLHTYRNLCM